MFSHFYLDLQNLRISSNDVSQVLTINQEIFFDQSQFILVVFLLCSLAFLCCVSVLLESLVYLILTVFVKKLS